MQADRRLHHRTPCRRSGPGRAAAAGLAWLVALQLACSTPIGPAPVPSPAPPSGQAATATPEPAPPPGPAPTEAGAPVAAATPTPRPGPGLLEPVSKRWVLPAAYVPDDLVTLAGIPATRAGLLVRRAVYAPLQAMLREATAQGLDIQVLSAFRSYQEQETIFQGYARSSGEAQANRFSARAGQSEHQLGTAVDLTSPRVNSDLVEAFGRTPEGRWLQENAHRFGFVMSYPEGKEEVTGYIYEPWHFRYVGPEVAAAVRARGVTLTEYLTAAGG